MKRAELEVGKVYAYSRYANPTATYQIGGFIIDSLEPVRKYGKTGPTIPEVTGRYTDKDGNPTAEPDRTTTIALRRLIGDYLVTKHSLELAEKNREIARLEKTIKSKEVQQIIDERHELFTERLGINKYNLSNRYNGKVEIELTLDQFKSLAVALANLKWYERQAELRAEEERKAREEQLTNA